MRESGTRRAALLALCVLGAWTSVAADDWIWKVRVPESRTASADSPTFAVEVIASADSSRTPRSLELGTIDFHPVELRNIRSGDERLLEPSLRLSPPARAFELTEAELPSFTDGPLRRRMITSKTVGGARDVDPVKASADPITQILRRLPLEELAGYGIHIRRGVTWHMTSTWSACVGGEWSLEPAVLPEAARIPEPQQYGSYAVHLSFALDI